MYRRRWLKRRGLDENDAAVLPVGEKLGLYVIDTLRGGFAKNRRRKPPIPVVSFEVIGCVNERGARSVNEMI
jgi:hypothetical protein